jgi:hypothetical protein
MTNQIHRQLTPLAEPRHGLTQMAAAEGPAIPVDADRLYQIAAVTAGLFLLITLL